MPELSGEIQQQSVRVDAAPTKPPVRKGSFLGERRDLEDSPNLHEEKISLKQREAMARCRVDVDSYMARVLAKDPRTLSKEEMQRWIEKKGKESGLTERQAHELHALTREYVRNNRLARELKETYRDDRELVRVLTHMDVPPYARLSIHVGPWGLEISADDKTIQYMLNEGGSPPANFHAGGFAMPDNIPPYIFFKKQFLNREILVHERQHAKYALNKRVMNQFHDYESSLVGSAFSQDSPQYGLESFMCQQRSLALERAKDEVFAYYLGQGRFPMDFFQIEDGNPYDYLKSERDFGRRSGFDPQYAQASERIYVQEYRRMLRAAVVRFDSLIQKAGYSSELAISLLVDVPLEHWEERIGEILAEKGYAQSQDTHPFPTKGWGTVRVQGKQVPLIDAVIHSEDRRPNWYKERSVVEGDSEQQKDQITSLNEVVNTKSAMVINQLLYQQTREIANDYITALSGEGHRRYFELLDLESRALGRIVPEGRPSRKQITEVVRKILKQLKVYKSQPDAL